MAGALAFAAAVWHVYAVIRYDPVVSRVPGLGPATAWSILGESWFGRGEALGIGPILVTLCVASLVRRISTSRAAGRLWQALWAGALVLALWWPAAVFAGPGDPVVAMGWFFAYGPTSLLLVLALPLWQAPSRERPSCEPTEHERDGHGRTD